MNLETELLATLRPLVQDEVARAFERSHAFAWPWATPAECGARLGISSAAVRNKIKRGKLPGRKFDDRWFIDMKALDRMIRSGR